MSNSNEERQPLSKHIQYALVEAYRAFSTFSDYKALYVVETLIRHYHNELTNVRGEINLPDFKPDEREAFRILNSACVWWFHIESEYRQEDKPDWQDNSFIEDQCRSEACFLLELTKIDIKRRRKWWDRRTYFKYLCRFLD